MGFQCLNDRRWGLINNCPVPVVFNIIALCSLQLLPIHTLRLGMEVDSFDGHHYISSIAPGGPVDTLNLLQPEDELLEVKTYRGRKTYGKMLSCRKLCSLTHVSVTMSRMPAIYTKK